MWIIISVLLPFLTFSRPGVAWVLPAAPYISITLFVVKFWAHPIILSDARSPMFLFALSSYRKKVHLRRHLSPLQSCPNVLTYLVQECLVGSQALLQALEI